MIDDHPMVEGAHLYQCTRVNCAAVFRQFPWLGHERVLRADPQSFVAMMTDAEAAEINAVFPGFCAR